MRNKAQKQQLMTCLEIKNKKKHFNTLQNIVVIFCLCMARAHGAVMAAPVAFTGPLGTDSPPPFLGSGPALGLSGC